MGNKSSNLNNNVNNNVNVSSTTSFEELIDYIATHYILTMDFKSMQNLYNKDYCNNLVILTSDVIKSKFNELEITYLSQRISEGVIVNKDTNKNITYFNKKYLDNINKNNINKNRICNDIAKFYIKIAHVFASIVMTINPIYIYTDVNGNRIKTPLYTKYKLSKNIKTKLYKLGLCNNRINSLKRGINDDNNIIVHPNICNINTNKNKELKTLQEEPGIPELYNLYLDKYDYEKGKFNSMNKETEQMYKDDLYNFYVSFTGEKYMPDNIKRFSDIKLRNYSDTFKCKTDVYKKAYKGTLKDELFKKYAEHLKVMISNANKKQENLLEIINDLFTYEVDEKTKNKIIRVNPSLNEVKLNEVIIKTRKILIDLYITCENDFVNGIKLYEAIVENQIRITSELQIKSLQETARMMYR